MKTLLITGAGSGIGLETCRLAAAAGHRVFAAIEFPEQRSALPASVTAYAGDLTDPAFRATLADACGGTIDVLVLNAGHGESGPLIEQPEERIRRLFEVNVISTITLAQLFGQVMCARRAGRLVFVTSMAGLVTTPYLGAYSGTKHALEAMIDALRLEIAQFGVSVVAVEPGLIYTGFNERMAATKFEWLREDSLYTRWFDIWRDQDASLPERSHSVIPVAQTVLRVATSTSPAPHNPTPWLVYGPLRILFSLLPTRLVDWMMTGK